MVVTDTLQTELHALNESVVAQVAAFPAHLFAIAPDPQSWSAAELAEHLLIVIKNINGVLVTAGSVPDRPADKKVPVIKAALEDRETKRIAPENVKPSGKMQEQKELTRALHEQMMMLIRTVQEKELTELCTVYPHPSLGRLTRLEWVNFIIYHTRRHLFQLAQMQRNLVG